MTVHANDSRPSPSGRVLGLWFDIAAVLLAGAVLALPSRALTDWFLRAQDMPVLIGILVVAAALRIGVALAGARGAAPPWTMAPPVRPIAVVLGLAAFSLLAGWAGACFVYDGYGLSLDEFMANFDATILSHGQPMAPVAAQWRAYLPALQPQFVLHTAGAAWWGLTYLPVNAALRAFGGVAGARLLVNPLLASVSVIAVFAVARKMWPERPGIALAAAILLATSSQFLVTAMTPYAMTAHLALNLVWLWLFLRGGRLGHAGAIGVGFLACGLHQLVFHPLFAAPFVAQLWLERRWRAAVLYTLAYAAIGLFWIAYPSLALAWLGVSAPAAGAVGAHHFGTQVVDLLRTFDPAGLGAMAINLIRFATWQNLATTPLVLMGAVAALRAKGTLRSLVLGLVLTLGAMFVLMPYQGHGWGYRYLHGLLGSACLLAAWTWDRLTDDLAPPRKAAGRAVFIGLAAASLLTLFPIRAWQVRHFVHPYAAAEAAIQHAGTQVVLVDDTGVWFGVDLVRNDPYLRSRPIVLALGALSEAGVRDLCARYSVSLFDRSDAAALGIRTWPRPPSARMAGLSLLLRQLDCGGTRLETGAKA